MWISLENRLVELWFHENLLGKFHGKTVDMTAMHNLSNMIHSFAWKWAPSLMAIRLLKSRWNGPKFEVEPLSAKDYSGLTKGMRLQAEADGKYWAAEVPGIPRGHVGEYPLLPSFWYVSSVWWVWSVTCQEFSVFGCRSKLDHVIVWSCLVLVFLALRCDFGCPGCGGFQEEEGHACEGHLHWLRHATSPEVWETYHPQLVHKSHSGSQS